MQLVVGRVIRPHGVHGEVVVEIHTDSPEERFTVGSVFGTDPTDIGLHHADPAAVDQICELVACGKPLAGGDGNGLFGGQSRVAGEIVGWERRLDEEQVQALRVHR